MLIIDPLDSLLNERDVYLLGPHLLNKRYIGRYSAEFFDEADL